MAQNGLPFYPVLRWGGGGAQFRPVHNSPILDGPVLFTKNVLGVSRIDTQYVLNCLTQIDDWKISGDPCPFNQRQ